MRLPRGPLPRDPAGGRAGGGHPPAFLGEVRSSASDGRRLNRGGCRQPARGRWCPLGGVSLDGSSCFLYCGVLARWDRHWSGRADASDARMVWTKDVSAGDYLLPHRQNSRGQVFRSGASGCPPLRPGQVYANTLSAAKSGFVPSHHAKGGLRSCRMWTFTALRRRPRNQAIVASCKVDRCAGCAGADSCPDIPAAVACRRTARVTAALGG